MMHGREKSDLAIVAMKPANKANEPTAEASTGANAAEPVERRAGAKGNAHQQSTYWTQSQVRVSQALARIRQLVPSHTRGRSRMRESRTYGSVRGACDETHVPTATAPRVHHPVLLRLIRLDANTSTQSESFGVGAVMAMASWERRRSAHYGRIPAARRASMVFSKSVRCRYGMHFAI